MKIRKTSKGWTINVDSENTRYFLFRNSATGRLDCDCRKPICIHRELVEDFIGKQKVQPKNEKKTYPQNWPSYNQAQCEEKLIALEILNDLCNFLPEEPKTVGRPKISTKDIVFSMVMKTYENLSSRRLESDLQMLKSGGFITHVPKFNTLMKYFNNPCLTPLLSDLIQLSALPVKGLEETFAIDSTGLSDRFYSRWFDHKYKKATHGWMKLHVFCGTRSHMITSVNITKGEANDCPEFEGLLKQTVNNGFNVKEITADRGYLSRNNMQVALDLGAFPLIPFKSNSNPKARAHLAWKQIYLYYQTHPEEFANRYHQRSNVESVFSSLKRKFDTKLMSRNFTAKINEALCMMLSYNIVCLVHQYFENDIKLAFKQDVHKFKNLSLNTVI